VFLEYPAFLGYVVFLDWSALLGWPVYLVRPEFLVRLLSAGLSGRLFFGFLLNGISIILKLLCQEIKVIRPLY
jgi:hypothetical protein